MKARPRRELLSSLDPAPRPGGDPVLCTLGDTLCRVRFWTEAEWERLPPERRPAEAVHRPGSGYLAPVRVADLP